MLSAIQCTRIGCVGVQGTICQDTGKVEMDFVAHFFASLAGLYKVSSRILTARRFMLYMRTNAALNA